MAGGVSLAWGCRAGSPARAEAGPPAARPPDKLAKAEKRIAELERLVGRQQADLDFFREALRSWDEKRRGSGAPISSRSSKK
jgi:transposase